MAKSARRGMIKEGHHAADLGQDQLGQRPKGDVGHRRARPRARADRRRRRLRRPRHGCLRQAQPQSTDSLPRRRRPRDLGEQCHRPLSGRQLRQRQPLAGGARATLSRGPLDGLEDHDPHAAAARDVLGVGAHARSGARHAGDRGGCRGHRATVAARRPPPGSSSLSRRRQLHHGRYPAWCRLLALPSTWRPSCRACRMSSVGTPHSSSGRPTSSTSCCPSPEAASTTAGRNGERARRRRGAAASSAAARHAEERAA